MADFEAKNSDMTLRKYLLTLEPDFLDDFIQNREGAVKVLFVANTLLSCIQRADFFKLFLILLLGLPKIPGVLYIKPKLRRVF